MRTRAFSCRCGYQRLLGAFDAEKLESRRLFSVPTGFAQEVVATGLISPTEMDVAPDGRIFVSQQTGQLRVIKNGKLLDQPFVSLTVGANGERGLLGVTFDPDFAANHYVYAYYTAKSPTTHNRISRFTANGDVAQPGSEVTILDLPTLSSSTSHNGGALHFGPDGKLYVAIGDNVQSTIAQSINSPFGKVLRINADGSIPTDGPFYNQTTGISRAIWTLGLRNPFSFAIQPTTGKTYINEVGDVGENAWEEINVGAPAANFGWPGIAGKRTTQPAPANYRDPIYTYNHGPGAPNRAIAGGVFYNPKAGAADPFPSAYTGLYFFGDFGAGWIKTMDSSGHVSPFATEIVRGVDIDLAPDGSLYYLQRGENSPATAGVYRIAATSANPAPSILQDPQDLVVSVGQNATFTIKAAGPGTLHYQWMRGSQAISGATAASYTLVDPQLSDSGAVFKCRVTNSNGSTTTLGATLTVSTDKPPVPVINTPASGAKFAGGTNVSFSGSASDPEDGTIPASGLTWSVSYFTGSVERPFVQPFSGKTGGSFPPSVDTPYLGTDVFYRIYLTATDSDGRKTTVFRDVKPTIAHINLAASTSGLKVFLDGSPKTTPFGVDSVAGLQRLLSAPTSQVLNGVTYDFVSWSDGGSATHYIHVPVATTTYTATYKVRTSSGKSLTPIADAYVAEGTPTANFGSATVLRAKKSATTYDSIAYLTFDLTGITTVNSAVLKLFGKLNESGSVNVTAYQVANTSWGQTSITYNNRPALGAAIGNVTVSGTTGKTYQWNVTSYLKSERAAGHTRVSIALFGLNETAALAIFNSREASTNKPILLAQ
jgi:glucose/arabinose dehydrogenase